MEKSSIILLCFSSLFSALALDDLPVFPTTPVVICSHPAAISNLLTVRQHLSSICLSGWEGLADVEIHSLSGQLVCRARIFSGAQISVQGVHSGLYISSVKTADSVKRMAFLLSK